MAVSVGQEAYTEQLLHLLPRGRAWPRAPGSFLRRLLAGVAAEFARLDAAGTALLDEAYAARAFELIEEWEKDLGLPDACTSLGATITARRAAAHEKETLLKNLHKSAFIELANEYGVRIIVSERDQARAQTVPGVDVSGDKWMFVWWISIPTRASVDYKTVLDDVDTPLAYWDGEVGHAELACRLQQIAPLHTLLVITHHNAPSLLRWRGSYLRWRGADLSWR